MAFVETNEEKLSRLNEDARAKQDRKLKYSLSFLESTEHFIKDSLHRNGLYGTGKEFPLTYKPGGNFLHRPFVDVPNLNLGMSLFTMQNAFKPKFCQIMERDFFRCLSRVGVQNTDRLCKIYWEDLLECQDHEKAKKRFVMMEKVRRMKKMAPMTNIPYSTQLDADFR
ncbi:unnamed protein product [Heterobilharzia americana]|nr:unnamed protein product [Heterobilharzia americana]